MRRGRLSDPAWKSGPREPSPTDSEHAIFPEDFEHNPTDWDGFGVDEAEMVEGEPLVALQEVAVCTRDGCDATHKRRLLFTTEPLSDAEERALDIVSGVDEKGVYVVENGERIDMETIRVDDTTITAEMVIENEPSGPCYGHEEPEPDVNAHRYGL